MDKVFSTLPLPAWGWLGVNEAALPAGLEELEPERQEIFLAEGEERELVLAEREAGSWELKIKLAPRASLRLVEVQLAPETAGCASRVTVQAAEGAHFSYTGVVAGGAESAAEVAVELAGEGSRAEVWALYFGAAGQRLDLNYRINQSGRDTRAEMQVRGALSGTAEKIFRGTLDFREGSGGSVGREQEEVVLLSDTVRNRSVPLMLSHEDDVDGKHGVSVGKMDEEKLFYLMSRGLDRAAARRLVVEAAFAPVLERLGQDELRREVGAYLQGRLTDG